jgi:tetratricopeptide (TPR) repeat protein
MENITRAAGFYGAVTEVEVDGPEAIDAPFSVRYEYEREDYGDWENRRIPAPLPIMITDPGESKEERTVPYWLGAPGRYEYESEIEIPKQYQAKIPDGVELEEAFAEYRSRYAFEGNRLRASRQLIVKRDEVSPGQYEAYRRFAGAVGEDWGVQIDLEERSSKEGSVPAQAEVIRELPDSQSADARQVSNEALARAKQEDLPGAIEALTRATAIDPNYARAWWMLGQIYLSMQQSDHAIDAFQHVVASAPGYPMGYRALATGLRSAKRYEEAVTVLQQLKGITPDDPATFAQLGLALVQAGQTEEALQAIDKARELGASPLVRLKIAHGLAEVDGQLPLALELASSAVEDLEALAAQIDLSDLSDEERVNSRILGAAWDVLGWVHFRMGHIAEADNYLTAAWTAMRDGEAAEHLGHVREAQGRKDAAIEMYALARAASPRNKGALEQLERLLGNDKLSREAIERARFSLLASRRHRLPRLVSGDATAEFWLLFAPESTVKAVRFIEGSMELKSAEESLRMLSLDAGIPKRSGARLLRRGHVLCYSIPGCELTLVDGSDSLSTLSN